MTNLPMIIDCLAFLGRKGSDKITGATGVITSVCFDLYGCIQIALHCGLDKDRKPIELFWYDISRIKILDEPAIMAAPSFQGEQPGNYAKGAAEKPKAKS